ncbi:uncharacterized protein LOC131004005 [Salvia miltiorrhiza]|uniref:uncharacterized protein LOC131004005 n=1 Tax=Salvia miltiorrhiza TaxID=226208 RepID=UPI0025AD3B47|nr:uncharacterized protein LOC131004005 [Salvia miltiorrhiza]
MFTSEEWTQNKLFKEAKGKHATKIALLPLFWNNIVYTLKVMAPLVRVLRLVDGEKKPAMGYIYEAMEKAKEEITKSSQNNESRYKEVFTIIDNRWNCQLHRPLHAASHFLNPDTLYENKQLKFDMEATRGLYDTIRRLVPSKDAQDKILEEMESYKSRGGLFGSDLAERQRKKIAPAQWWRMYGHSTPNLQQLAIKILGLTCSASECERNWSYNQKLVDRHNRRHEIDPISLNDIDECNEWLAGEVDDENDEENDLVFDDDSLNWDTVYEASRAGKRKQPSTGVGDSSRARGVRSSKKSTMTSTSSRSKGKGLERVLKDEEFDDKDEIDENDEKSEGEEE